MSILQRSVLRLPGKYSKICYTKIPFKMHNKLCMTSIRYLLIREGLQKSLFSRGKKCSQLRNNVVNRENLSFLLKKSDFVGLPPVEGLVGGAPPWKHMFAQILNTKGLPIGKQWQSK